MAPSFLQGAHGPGSFGQAGAHTATPLGVSPQPRPEQSSDPLLEELGSPTLPPLLEALLLPPRTLQVLLWVLKIKDRRSC